MDFEKIYADFDAARSADDLETMSKIIAQVNLYCTQLVDAGRANEIPPEEKNITQYIAVSVFRAMQHLTDGDAATAKFYLWSLANRLKENCDAMFFLYYLLGKSFYATGDFATAIKIFERYEKIRAAAWNDVDELSLFYRANCFALLGDFDAAAELYRQALTIKADFPEAKRNLKLAERRSIKNLAREIKSLWYFPNWRDVPIFINARDRLGVMKKLIDWLLDAGYRKIFVLDNRSTYPPLLEYYCALEKDRRVKIIRPEKNFGFKALWQSGVLEQLKISTPYIYTDPDVLPVEDCPPDFVKRLMRLLDANHELRKVGLGLVWKDITFFDRERVQKLEAQLYEGTRIGDELYFAQVDTTFALYSNVRHYSLRLSLRTAGELRAYHLPWYFDYNNLPDDEKYYMTHADKNSVTTVKKFLAGNTPSEVDNSSYSSP